MMLAILTPILGGYSYVRFYTSANHLYPRLRLQESLILKMCVRMGVQCFSKAKTHGIGMLEIYKHILNSVGLC
jgi:hypothetical protein